MASGCVSPQILDLGSLEVIISLPDRDGALSCQPTKNHTNRFHSGVFQKPKFGEGKWPHLQAELRDHSRTAERGGYWK